MESELYPEDCMVVTKISSYWVNGTSTGRDQTARSFFWLYFSSIFLESSQGPHS